MPGIKHATKKRFAKSTTTKRSIQSGISAEYTENRSKLERIVEAVKNLIKKIHATAHVWGQVATHQSAFASALLASLPVDGLVQSHAREVEATVRDLQRLLLDDDSTTTPHRRIMTVLDSYLKLVENVQADYPAVETSYTEVVRYQKKVDKLSKKGRKNPAILQRNVDKLSSARSEYDIKLKAVLERMKPAFDKHEAVFQCAHHAFWLAQEKYSATINETTKNIRWESVAVREHITNVDVNKSPRLPPIGRAQLILPPESFPEVSSMPVIERPLSERELEPAPVLVSPTPQPPQKYQPQHSPRDTTILRDPFHESASASEQPVVHLTPQTPTVRVSLPASANEVVTVRRATAKGELVHIPAVPTEKPAVPAPQQRSVNAGEAALV